MRKLFLVLMISLLITGCSNKEDNTGTADAKDIATDKSKEQASVQDTVQGYQFKYNNVVIDMNTDAEPIVEALGEPQEYFEAESCAFKGLDKFYYYNGIELTTYPTDNKDFISSINFSDDSVSTMEGIYLGATLQEVVQAYGEEYIEEAGLYTFTRGKSKLTFLVEDEVVTTITYLAVVDELE